MDSQKKQRETSAYSNKKDSVLYFIDAMPAALITGMNLTQRGTETL